MSTKEYIDERKRRLKSHFNPPETIESFSAENPTLGQDLATLKQNFIPQVGMHDVDRTFELALKHLEKGDILDAEVYLCKTIHDALVISGCDVKFSGLADGVYDAGYVGKLARVYVLDKQQEYL